MVLDQLASFATPVIYGLGFRQSFALTRSFTVGWKEQQGLCSFDYLIGIGTTVTAAYANLEAIKGTAFANKVWKLSYGAYAAVPALYYCMSRLHRSEAREQSCERVLREFPPQNDDDTRSVGNRVQDRFFNNEIPKDFGDRFNKRGAGDNRTLEKRIFDYLENVENRREVAKYKLQYMTWDHANLAKKMARDESGGNGRVAELVKLFPKNGSDDSRTLGERIDADLENYTRSSLEKKTKELLDFTFMHIPDILLLASVTHTVAAIYIGFNQTSNMVNLAFYGWSVAEQGLFWDKPAEDKGFLMGLKDGDVVRAYEPFVSTLTEYNTLLYMFLFRGIIGKALCALAAFLKYSPDSWKTAIIPDKVKKYYNEVVEMIKEDEFLKNFKIPPEKQPDPKKTFIAPVDLNLNAKELHLLKPFLNEKLDLLTDMKGLAKNGHIDFFETFTVEAKWGKLIELLGDGEDAREARRYVEYMNTRYSDHDHDGKEKKSLWGMLIEELEEDRPSTLRRMEQRFRYNHAYLDSEHEYFVERRIAPIEERLDKFVEFKTALSPIPGQVLAGTKKMFQKFVLEDLFPNQSMAEMEKSLQDKLAESLDKEERTVEWKEALERLLGKDGSHGWLYEHVMESRDTKEKEEKEVQLKVVYGAALNNWDHWGDVLAGRNEGCLCRPATAQTLYETALEAYPEVSGMGGHDGPQQGIKNRLTAGIQLVLQQRRDFAIQSALQSLSYIFLQQEEIIREQVSEGMQENTQNLADEDGLQGRIRGWAQAGLVRGGVECCFGLAHGIGTSRHINNLATTFVGSNLGLSNYDEAERDVSKMLNRVGLEASLFNLPKDTIKPFLEPFQNYTMLYGTPGREGVAPAFDGLVDATYVQEDTRINFEDVKLYFSNRYKAGEVTLLEAIRNAGVAGQIADLFEDGMLTTKELDAYIEVDFVERAGENPRMRELRLQQYERNKRFAHSRENVVRYFREEFRNTPITAENVHEVKFKAEIEAYMEYMIRNNLMEVMRMLGESGIEDPGAVLKNYAAAKHFAEDCARVVPPHQADLDEEDLGRLDSLTSEYTVRSKLFLNKYLPQVLYDLGFFAERD